MGYYSCSQYAAARKREELSQKLNEKKNEWNRLAWVMDDLEDEISTLKEEIKSL